MILDTWFQSKAIEIVLKTTYKYSDNANELMSFFMSLFSRLKNMITNSWNHLLLVLYSEEDYNGNECKIKESRGDKKTPVGTESLDTWNTMKLFNLKQYLLNLKF